MELRWIKATSYCVVAIALSNFTSHCTGEESTTIRVLSYNVQFLPAPADARNKRPRPKYRARRIAEESSKYDIVGLQETFHEVHRTQIVERMKQAWNGTLNSVVSPTPKEFYTSGGCLLATRLPIVSSSSTVFKNFSKPADYGFRADGFAAKGVIHGRILRDAESPDDFIEVFATHLEARADELRPLQYGEMATFIKAASDPARPAIIMGDMNTRGARSYRDDPNSQYSKLVKQLQDARPQGHLLDVWPALKGDALGGTSDQESDAIGKRIDYIFVINPPKPFAQLKPTSVAVRMFQDPKVVALSDHNGVEAEFEWTRQSPKTP